jgi:HTH-type transcriptional regulator / antitoxin HipB
VPKERAAAVKAHVGRRISQVRRALGVPQEQLAAKLDVTTQWFSRVENGHENLTIETLVRVANALGVRAVELFQEDEAAEGLPNRVPRRDAKRRKRATRL